MRAAVAMSLFIAACTANDDVPAPRIASITPERGRPGTSVVVSGIYFCQQPDPEPDDDEVDPLACRVTGSLRFGFEPANVTLYTDTSITALVPEMVPSQTKVHLDVGGRTSNGVSFVVE